jgi:transposase
MGPERRRIEAQLAEGTALAYPKSAALCRSLLERTQALWMFVAIEGVEPTNNAGERAVRHGVLWRNVSFETQSEQGSRFVERLLTTLMPCRPPGRNVLDFLVAARSAALNGTPAPSLVPRTRSPSGCERLLIFQE